MPGTRSVLPLGVVVAVVLLAVLIGGFTTPAAGQSATDRTYVLTQGDRCVTVTPLRSGTSVSEFYDYASSDSLGTTDVQRPNTSILFLLAGPAGTSLVLVHGMADEASQGGSVSMTITGLPNSGEWVVEDDHYGGPTNYDTWNHTDGTSRIDWTWQSGKTDGGAFYGLDGMDESIEITPRFNEAAALYGEHYDGDVTGWEFLSGDRSNPDRISLDMDSALAIGTGDCPGSRNETAGDADDGNDETDDGTGRDGGDDQGSLPRSDSVDDGEDSDGDGGRGGYLVCHVPPGNPNAAHTITVGSESAVDTHVAHGDSRGACPGNG